MTRLQSDSDDTLLALEVPADGCWVATPCTLRVHATASGRLGRTDPTVLTHTGTLEVLGLSPEFSDGGPSEESGNPVAWLVRVIAFDDGDVTTPVMSLQVSRGDAAPQVVAAPITTLQVRQRELPPGTTLADIEGPLEARMTLADAMVTAGLVTTVLVLTIGLAWCIRRLLSVRVLRVRLGPDAGPLSWRRAARSLRRLRRSARRQTPSQVYSTMVDILRRTLLARLGELALSSTSSELVELIEHQASATLARQQLAPLLAVSDEVKFAGHRPEGHALVADCSRAIDLVLSFERAGLTRAPVPSQS